MKVRFSVFFLVLFLSSVVFAAEEAPREIAGFKLGASITEYQDQLVVETALPLRHSEFLAEVDVRPPDGFKSGYLTYGRCEVSDRIVRVKLKYERDDREFFNELMEQFTKKFGKPAEYKGDAFRACLAWKWNFTSNSGEKISLLLAHRCDQDEDVSSGNAVKLTLRSAIESERLCFDKKFRQAGKGENSDDKQKGKPDFRMLIPN